MNKHLEVFLVFYNILLKELYPIVNIMLKNNINANHIMNFAIYVMLIQEVFIFVKFVKEKIFPKENLMLINYNVTVKSLLMQTKLVIISACQINPIPILLINVPQQLIAHQYFQVLK